MSVYVRILLIACVMYEPKWTDAVHTCTYVGSRLPSSARYFVTVRKVGYNFINTLASFCDTFCSIYICTFLKSSTYLLGIEKVETIDSKVILPINS